MIAGWSPQRHKAFVVTTPLHSENVVEYALFLRFENRKFDGFGHRLVARVVRVEVIAGIELGAKLLWVIEIAGCGIEVDNGVESPAGTDPTVHSLANRVAFLAIVACAGVRCERATNDLDPV